ncbi:MAG: hypothetical protein K2Q22_01170 [Cytophagales bacterium]|nr:hypothetical protein [Cytophagales bacterium]
MKRPIAIALFLFYSFFSVGIVLSQHYCGGKLVASSVLPKGKTKSCPKCGTKKMPKDCCKDTQTQLSADDNQKLPENDFSFTDLSTFIALLPKSILVPQKEYAVLNSNTTRFYVFETGPPKTPIYIQIRSLVI